MLRHHPNLQFLLVFSMFSEDAFLEETNREIYHRSILLHPLPIPWNVLPLRGFIINSKLVQSSFTLEKTYLFYLRLQLFLCTLCDQVYAFDTGDMLVVRPFIDVLSAHIRYNNIASNSSFGASSSRCQEIGGFMTVPSCYKPNTNKKYNYFNAGMYVVSTVFELYVFADIQITIFTD